jgi:hypothetical protein
MALPLLVDARFQVLFHSPNGGSFHLSLTVLVHYRSLGSIEPCEMVLADSHRVPRVPWYLGRDSKEPQRFRLRGYYPLWPNFPEPSANAAVCNSSTPARGSPNQSHDTGRATLARLAHGRYFGNRICFFFLGVLRWFNSPRSPPPSYEFRGG